MKKIISLNIQRILKPTLYRSLKTKCVVILGAGPSGRFVANTLKNKGLDILIIDSNIQRCGRLYSTYHKNYGSISYGANWIHYVPEKSKRSTVLNELFKNANLHGVLTQPCEYSKIRFVNHNGDYVNSADLADLIQCWQSTLSGLFNLLNHQSNLTFSDAFDQLGVMKNSNLLFLSSLELFLSDWNATDYKSLYVENEFDDLIRIVAMYLGHEVLDQLPHNIVNVVEDTTDYIMFGPCHLILPLIDGFNTIDQARVTGIYGGDNHVKIKFNKDGEQFISADYCVTAFNSESLKYLDFNKNNDFLTPSLRQRLNALRVGYYEKLFFNIDGNLDLEQAVYSYVPKTSSQLGIASLIINLKPFLNKSAVMVLIHDKHVEEFNSNRDITIQKLEAILKTVFKVNNVYFDSSSKWYASDFNGSYSHFVESVEEQALGIQKGHIYIAGSWLDNTINFETIVGAANSGVAAANALLQDLN
jgi:hypothetical protein